MGTENIVREGTVTAVNKDKRLARVWFDAMGIPSDWLPVLVNGVSFLDYNGRQIDPWLPKINDKVLVLCFPVFNGDGVILGGVNPWQ